MTIGFYAKLAFEGMRKNRQLYIPYLLTGAGMVAMFYILTFLSRSGTLSLPLGEGMMRTVLGLGTWVVALFSLLFLFYTNAFLMRRRKKEFGLYNILGMGKRDLSLILFWESVMVAAVSLAAGLVLGVALSKAAELGMLRLLGADATFDFKISIEGICHTVTVYSPIFLLLYLNGLRQLRFSTALSLLHSENTGEKPPKANWFLGILGAVVLGAAYYLAVSIKDPISAIMWFFVAVLMVIVATYLLMIAGSVLLCRVLQRNRRYYYRPNHFVSVSSMVYRMKRNGAGLASICILATMVLVMLSSTATLYFGGEDALLRSCPREINARLSFPSAEELEKTGVLCQLAEEVCSRHGAEPQNMSCWREGYIVGLLENGVVELDASQVNDFRSFDKLVEFQFIPIDDYNAVMGTHETLGAGEALLCDGGTGYRGEFLSFRNGPTFRVAGRLERGLEQGDGFIRMTLVVSDLGAATERLARLADFNGERMISFRWYCSFDTGLPETEEEALYQDWIDALRDFAGERWGETGYRFARRNAERADFYGTFGGFFYLGVLLSIVFLCATVLIIYYKQLSEGFEDGPRFEIMRKVGMTGGEIRKSVDSQLLTVFFLPLLGAGLHLAFAFPMIRKLLLLFKLNNAALFAKTCAISFLIFSVFYLLVYRGTSNAYYRLVSSSKSR